MVSFIQYLPAPNSLTGLIVYSLTFYLIILSIAWCLQPKEFDLESHRKLIIKAREEREAKAKRIIEQRDSLKNK